MSEPSTEIPIEVAIVTDRGLSQKRPLNEDSYLADATRRIFAVADGVGGAESGEVASQTAIDVLDEAFKHHQNGDDAEDLMEIAIQRANASIHQLSREHAKLSMMATTMVALHLDGLRATLGHVGDSRLYRLSSDGSIHRETDDHSVVEEEVRAGRMTPEQAANHPSRNVISRALGAEASVEVDMKTIEVERGTSFILCSDGITRHLPDAEISDIMNNSASLEAACGEMKRRCFERGAEDNLTAVIVRIGEASSNRASASSDADEEATIIAQRPKAAFVNTLSDESPAPSNLRRPFSDVGTRTVEAAPTPPRAQMVDTEATPAAEAATTKAAPAPKSSGSAGWFLGVLLFLIAASALAFYAGMIFEKRRAPGETAQAPLASTPTPSIVNTNEGSFDARRRRVDLNPAEEATRLAAELNAQPTATGGDPASLYFYGRALFLSGRHREAIQAFDQAIKLINENTTHDNAELKIESLLATAAAKLRTDDVGGARKSVEALDEMFRQEESAPPSVSPSATAPPQQ